ncbi:TetR/AcrR family transcriptional regulator [Elizabethkingia occulta]|uniref:TetR/AcrR family transcriptional regulator n=1 Tax=Elizabethkingia occulta TaxID=1867263 RepID=UPI00398C3B21
MGRKRKEVPETTGQKVRKVTSGLLRDKERTKARLVAAVGKVIQRKGYTGLNSVNIATECGVNRKLIQAYFGNVDNLVEEYIQQRDFWKFVAQDNIRKMLENPDGIDQNDLNNLLQGQLDSILKDKVLQRIIHWELGANSKVLRKVADNREKIGEELFAVIEPEFKEVDFDIRAMFAILVSSIYYLSLHAKNNGSLFCGIDLNQESGKQQISDMIKQLIDIAYSKSKK